MNRLLLLLTPCLCVALLFSCKKEEEEFNPRNTIVAGRWVLSADTFVTAGGPTEVYQAALQCGKDDYHIFWNSGQYFYDQGEVKCDTAAIQRKEFGVWTYNTSDSILFISDGPLGGPSRLKRIDENEIHLWRETTFNGDAAVRRLRLTSIN